MFKRLGGHRRRMQETVELNITAFLNLMVILVPFLLITAVFSRLTVLELNLPALNAQAQQPENEPVKLQLELLVRPDSFVIQDANIGPIKRFDRQQDNTDWQAFTDVLVEIKRRFPDEDSITLLLERKTDYKTLIAIMDRVRSADILQFNTVVSVELFPNISIADAPIAAVENSTADGSAAQRGAP